MKAEITWSKMLQGDNKALEVIYRDHVHALYEYGNKISGNEVMTEDCIQALFIEIWEKRKNLSETKHVKPYLMLSLRRRIYREIRSGRNEIGLESISNFEAQIDLDPESTLIAAEDKSALKERLEKALSSLNEQQKEILYLKFEQNLSNQEIATILGIKHQSLRNALHRAINKLKDLLLFLTILSTMTYKMYLINKVYF